MKKEYGAKVEDITVLIGPGIGGCCYSVDRERADKFAEIGEKVVERRKGIPYLDLKEANRILLTSEGIEDIRMSRLCTSCTEALGSYRRQGSENFTRMLAMIGHF
jgi:copper oxidase (laccase) domain-containing protein